jgi:hypothetical protein
VEQWGSLDIQDDHKDCPLAVACMDEGNHIQSPDCCSNFDCDRQYDPHKESKRPGPLSSTTRVSIIMIWRGRTTFSWTVRATSWRRMATWDIASQLNVGSAVIGQLLLHGGAQVDCQTNNSDTSLLWGLQARMVVSKLRSFWQGRRW